MTISVKGSGGLTGSADVAAAYANVAYTLPAAGVRLPGDLILAFYGGKPYDTVPGTPTGYTSLGSSANGSTAMGSGTGSVIAAAFRKTHGPTEANPASVMATQYSPAMRATVVLGTDTGDPGLGWTVASCHGNNATATGTTYTATGDATLALAAGDVIVVSLVHNDDSSADSAFAVTVPGCTVGTVTQQLATTTLATGNQGRMYVLTAPITAGTATGAPTVTATVGTGDADGASVFVAVREPPAPTSAVVLDTTTLVAETGGTLTFTHTPAKALRGVVVVVSGEATSGHPITGVTYGGVAMAKVASGWLTGADTMALSVWHLGTGIPTGAQSVVATSVAGVFAVGACYGLWTLDGSDTELVTFAQGTPTGTAITPSLTIPSGRDVFMAGGITSDAAALTDVTDGADLTRVQTDDYGSMVSIINRRTSIYTGTGSAYTGFAWTQLTSQAAAYGVAAIGAVAGSAPAAPAFEVWTGSAWVKKPVKMWTGSAWAEKPLKRWDGTQWEDVT